VPRVARYVSQLADLNNSPCFSRILVHGVDSTILRLGNWLIHLQRHNLEIDRMS
jgi:hypothetical protein